ncbi:MAG TPA: aminopeptidase, partial [Roseomonas sp.]
LQDRIGDDVPLAEIIEAATRVRNKSARLGSQAAVDGAQAARLDTVLMQVSRALVPLDYTHGDRFVHDPALPNPSWPVLVPLRRLAEAEAGSDAARFARVSAVRARNRVLHALTQAEGALNAALS